MVGWARGRTRLARRAPVVLVLLLLLGCEHGRRLSGEKLVQTRHICTYPVKVSVGRWSFYLIGMFYKKRAS